MVRGLLRRHVTSRAVVVSGSAEAQGLLRGGEERLGGEGGDGLPPADEDAIHGGGRPRRHVSRVSLCFRRREGFTGRDKHLFPVSCSECCGALEYYDKAFDRITTRNEKQLKSIKRIFHTVTTTDDPVIRKVTPITSRRKDAKSHVCLSFRFSETAGFVLFHLPAAGEDSGERVRHGRHPGHLDVLHALSELLGHHRAESGQQAVL